MSHDMRAVVLDGGFGLEHLQLCRRSRPSPGPGQVLLRVRCASLNQRDLRMVLGQYYARLPMPLVVASDAVATVEAHGQGVALPALGTRVCPLFAPGWMDGPPPHDVFATTLGGPRDGTLSEYMVVDSTALVEVPDTLSDAQAASLPCAGLTAFSALFTLGKLEPGQHVLCLGTGAVSLFALQFAKAHGAIVTVTSKSDEKLARAERLGADHLVNYQKTPDWGRQLKKSMGGVDHVIEIGGAGTLEQSLAALRPGGSVSLIGVLSGEAGPVNLLPIVMRQLKVQGVFVGHKRTFVEMLRFIRNHSIEPVIGPMFELGQFAQAFQQLAAQQHFGKICVKLA